MNDLKADLRISSPALSSGIRGSDIREPVLPQHAGPQFTTRISAGIRHVDCEAAVLGPTSTGETLVQRLIAKGAVWQRLLQPPWTFRCDWPVALPLLALAAITLLFRFTSLDQTISGWFYDPQSDSWPWFFFTPCTMYYRAGIYPPIVLITLGAVLCLFGWIIDRTFSVSRAGLFLVLVMLIGPGLIVNLGFKGHFGRARPHQVQEFGGRYQFSPIGTPGPMLHGNSSFPSGHAAMGFYLMAPGFLISRQRPRLMCAVFFAGTLYGLGMSVTRVIQGGHFTSDTLWAGGIVYLVGAILARIVLRPLRETNGITRPV